MVLVGRCDNRDDAETPRKAYKNSLEKAPSPLGSDLRGRRGPSTTLPEPFWDGIGVDASQSGQGGSIVAFVLIFEQRNDRGYERHAPRSQTAKGIEGSGTDIGIAMAQKAFEASDGLGGMQVQGHQRACGLPGRRTLALPHRRQQLVLGFPGAGATDGNEGQRRFGS